MKENKQSNPPPAPLPYPYGYYPPQFEEDEINLLDYWKVLVAKKRMIATIVVLSVIVGVAVALLMPPVYRADVLLAPAEADSQGASSLGQFGGLASMVGINLPSGGSTEHSLAVLKSRRFIESFVEDEQLLPILYTDIWDAVSEKWLVDDPEEIPTSMDAYEYLTGGVIHNSVAKDTGLVTVAIEWTDPEQAAHWANQLVARLNAHLRQQAILESEQSIQYLEGEINRTQVVEMQQVLYRLIESETQKITLANVRADYAFKIIDPAVVPQKPVKPKRKLIVVLAFMAGLMCAIFVAFFMSFIERQKQQAAEQN